MRPVVAWLLELACGLTRHWSGCALLNRRIYLGYDDQADTFRVDLPSPTYRLWRWAIAGRPLTTATSEETTCC